MANQVFVGKAMKEIQKRLNAAGNEIADYLQQELKRVVGTETDPYTPSEPGDPPHVKTGELRASIFGEYDPSTMTVYAGSTSIHGVWTEFGNAPHPHAYEPRPWLETTVVNAAPREILSIIQKHFRS